MFLQSPSYFLPLSLPVSHHVPTISLLFSASVSTYVSPCFVLMRCTWHWRVSWWPRHGRTGQRCAAECHHTKQTCNIRGEQRSVTILNKQHQRCAAECPHTKQTCNIRGDQRSVTILNNQHQRCAAECPHTKQTTSEVCSGVSPY